jgi:hypothetical protein
MDASRRHFLTSASSGLGGVALSALLNQELEAAGKKGPSTKTHFPAKAKRCIMFYMAGAPSQLDLFNPKPKLNELNGQALPDSMLEGKQFAFIKKETAKLMGTNRVFKQHGQSGMWFSDVIPNIARHADDICKIDSMYTDQFNHHPAQLRMLTGLQTFNNPSIGSWLQYGLGKVNDNLPAYVVLTAGRGSTGGSTLYQSGYMPSAYAGVPFRSEGEPILNLNNPAGLPNNLQRKGLDALSALNIRRANQIGDDEIDSRIANYELAYRMQSSAPELMDLSQESEATKEAYGLNRKPKTASGRGGGGENYHTYAKNCLFARRMIERGVRFVNIIHASWDSHSNMDKDMAYNCGMVDQPIGALMDDLKQRGLLDDTLLIWCGEFGRTPLGENRPGYKVITGRDHHPDSFSIWMAGGGVKGGYTHGLTDEIGWGIEQDPVHVNDFQATLLELFGLDHHKLTYRYQGIDQRLTTIVRESHVIRDLIS